MNARNFHDVGEERSGVCHCVMTVLEDHADVVRQRTDRGDVTSDVSADQRLQKDLVDEPTRRVMQQITETVQGPVTEIHAVSEVRVEDGSDRVHGWTARQGEGFGVVRHRVEEDDGDAEVMRETQHAVAERTVDDQQVDPLGHQLLDVRRVVERCTHL